MLNISKAMVANAVKAYFKAGDYYIDGYNPPGIWGGKLMDEFGLRGLVDKTHFDRLADAYHPITGEDLTQVRLPNRRSANDITFSAPKDFSLAYLAATPEKRQKLMDLFVRTIHRTMYRMEEDAAARVRLDGADYDRRTGNWGYGLFPHLESRPDGKTELPVIQIHGHAVVFNLTRDPEEQRIKALQIGEVKKNADYWMPYFHNELAKGLRELGLGIKKERATGIVGFAIHGVPRELVERLSPRRAKILEVKEAYQRQMNDPKVRAKIAEEAGITDPGRLDALIKERLKLFRKDIGVITRKHKQKDLDHATLWKVWQRMLTPEDRKALEGAWGRTGWETTNAEAASYAIDHLFDKQSVLEGNAEKKLLIEALRYGVGSVDADGLREEFRKQGVLFVGGDATTRQNLAQEQFIVDFTREGMGKVAPVERARSEPQFPSLLAPKHSENRASHAHGPAPVRNPRPASISGEKLPSAAPALSAEQRNAVHSLLTSPNVVNMVDAGQGTGKTTLLEVYGGALAAHGVGRTWLGTTHTAVEELKKVGLPAMTVAAFLHSTNEQEKAVGTRIIVDEASMLSHRDSYDLFRYAKEHGNRIDLVGDSKQYKTPSAGHPMKLLAEFGGVKPITMTQTRRQTGKLKEAMEAILADKELKGHDILKELGMVHELPHEELSRRAADLYLKWTQPGESIPCVSPTHAQAAEIAAMIREGLKARGDLKGDDHTVKRLVNLGWSDAQLKDAKKHGAEGVTLLRYGAYREEALPLAVGDRVRSTMIGKTADGHKINTGQRYMIQGFTEQGDPILNNGWVVSKDWGGLNQDYVSTGQASQGKTAPRGIVVYGTPSLVATKHEGFYVPVSRVRMEVAVLTDSNEHLRQAIQRRESKKLASELVQPKKKPQRRAFPRLQAVLKKARERLRAIQAGLAIKPTQHEHGKERDHVGFER